ncbi:MAG TPA: hypothetical protein VGC92_03860 [Phenylobacterium sp.]|jgi:hypothetical protein
MRTTPTAAPLAALLATIALSACSKSDTAPTPAHNDVATSMPDAASTPGAVGPATDAPHAAPPPAATLSDTQPPPAGDAGTRDRATTAANPADRPR